MDLWIEVGRIKCVSFQQGMDHSPAEVVVAVVVDLLLLGWGF